MRLIALLFMLIAPSWAWADQYICIPEKAVGFYLNENSKEWEIIQFTTKDKYLVSLKTNRVTEFGHEDVLFESCSVVTVGKDSSDEVFLCADDKKLGEFKMSESSLRFQRYVSYFDYVTETGEGTPLIQQGSCAKF
jgi:hypothetical protein